VRAEDFSEQPRESRHIDSEVKVRREICSIFCKEREDFINVEDFNDYLMEREDIIFRLVNPTSQQDVQETRRRIDQYREQNAEQILRAQRLEPRKKLQKILNIIEEEGVFCTSVNAEWGMAPSVHPFQVRYRSMLDNPPDDVDRDCGIPPVDSPFAPQPLCGEYGPADVGRQMSGGGQSPGMSTKKARHFFFADLVAATGVVASAA